MSVEDSDAYRAYVTRFEQRFGAKPQGAFVKFGRAMVARLGPDELPMRLERYAELRTLCIGMLNDGATISEALILEFDEAAAWVAIEAPDLLQLFQGEVGKPASEDEPPTVPLLRKSRRPSST